MAATYSPRTFAAFAKPGGDHPDGHCVLLVETCGRSRRERVFTRAEAEQVHAELDAALRAFFAAEALSLPDTPRAATAPYPFTGHRALDQVPQAPGDGPPPVLATSAQSAAGGRSALRPCGAGAEVQG